MSRRVAFGGIFIALAMIFSYLEFLIPINIGIPGIKLGLANLVIVTGLYYMKLLDVCIISLVRILLSALLFGNLMSLIYSLAGGALSLVIMIILKKTGRFSIVGVSMAGGVLHNTGQILAAMLATSVPVIAYYLPVLMIAGLITGFIMGFIAGQIMIILR